MAGDKAILKELVCELSKKELVDIVLKLASKRYNYEFLLINYLDKEGGEQTLFEEARDDIDTLCLKDYKGKTLQHQQVRRLGACMKRIGEFTVEAKSKKLEADLLLYVLEKQFSNTEKLFGARFAGYDYKVGLLLKRLITLLTKKMHPDYWMDYKEKINEFLLSLHRTSNHINTIDALPTSLD